MGDQQSGHADLLKESVHGLDQLRPRDCVEGAEGFVEQNDLRLGGQRSSQRHSLPLTTGELARPTASELAGWQPHELERLGAESVGRRHPP